MTTPTPTPDELKRAQLRIAAIRDEISSRLWPVNSGMSTEMFNDLMDRMALLQYNFEQRIVTEGREGERRQGELDRRTALGLPPTGSGDEDPR
ncbi:hypothetical protein BH11GEM1_BH11GEM1_17100 [soil metagenome]